jgi:hypothetical protein
MALGVCLGEWSTLRRRMTVMMFGRSERIRTSDPLVPNEVRYQAALHSDPAAARAAFEGPYSH